MKELRSTCCFAYCHPSYGQEGTNYMVCTKCLEACDWKEIDYVSYTIGKYEAPKTFWQRIKSLFV